MKQVNRFQLLADVILIISITALVYVLYYLFSSDIVRFATDPSKNILLRTLFLTVLHFCQGGLALTVIMLIRKEKLIDKGLSMDNIIPSLMYSSVLIIIYCVVIYVRGIWRLTYPFRTTMVYDQLISQPIPIMVTGFLLLLITCGFFEAYNYAYISRKINLLIPVKNVFLRPGTIFVSIAGYIAHSIVGMNGWIGSLPLLVLLYGLMVVYEKTDNAWGCVLAFSMLWTTL